MSHITLSLTVRMHYEVVGVGRPVVFIHGWCMSSAVWRYQVEALQSRFQVVTCDIRGHGQSTDGDEISVADVAADVTALLELLDLRNVLLVGWSMGAHVALAVAGAAGGRVSGLMLTGGTPKFTSDDSWPYGLPDDEARGMALRVRRQYLSTMEDFFRRMFAPGEVSPQTYADIVRDVVKTGTLPSRETALIALDALVSADLRETAARLTQPVTLVHGTADTICLPGASAWMASVMPAARLHFLEGVGHAPFLSRSQEFNLLLEQFACTLP